MLQIPTFTDINTSLSVIDRHIVCLHNSVREEVDGGLLPIRSISPRNPLFALNHHHHRHMAQPMGCGWIILSSSSPRLSVRSCTFARRQRRLYVEEKCSQLMIEGTDKERQIVPVYRQYPPHQLMQFDCSPYPVFYGVIIGNVSCLATQHKRPSHVSNCTGNKVSKSESLMLIQNNNSNIIDGFGPDLARY